MDIQSFLERLTTETQREIRDYYLTELLLEMKERLNPGGKSLPSAPPSSPPTSPPLKPGSKRKLRTIGNRSLAPFLDLESIAYIPTRVRGMKRGHPQVSLRRDFVCMPFTSI